MAGQVVRRQLAVFGAELRFDRSQTVGKDFVYALADHVPVVRAEELERMHGCNFVWRVARGDFEIAIPTQESALPVVEIDDAGQVFDHHVGEAAFVVGARLDLSPFGVVGESVECK